MRGLRSVLNVLRAFFSGLRDGFAEGRRRARGGGTGIHDDPALRYGFVTCSEPDCDWMVVVSVDPETGLGSDRIKTAWGEHVRRDHPEIGEDTLS